MAFLKKKIVQGVERAFGAFGIYIARPGTLHHVIERHHLSRFFKHFEVDCVFDVGANAGQYAEMVRSDCGFSGPIISFEPIPSLAATLRQKAASLNNWFVEEVVLSSKSGPVTFNVMAGDKFSSLNKPSGDEQFSAQMSLAQALTVEATTLADQFDKYQSKLGFKRPFLKMDTQGSDLEVAKGAGDRLRQFVGLQSELSFEPLYQNVPVASQALEFYRSQGFALTAFVPNNAGHFPRLLEMDCICYRTQAS